MRIIVADDEIFARKAIVKMLREVEPEAEICLEAETGQEILDYMKDHSADLILTDIRMPEKDGLEVAECIQKTHSEANVAIISGYADFAYASAAIRFGGNARTYQEPTCQEEAGCGTGDREQDRTCRYALYGSGKGFPAGGAYKNASCPGSAGKVKKQLMADDSDPSAGTSAGMEQGTRGRTYGIFPLSSGANGGMGLFLYRT